MDNLSDPIKLFKCESCDKIYKTKNGLWKHNVKYHEMSLEDKKKEYCCEICGKIYQNKFSKYKHKVKCDKENNEKNQVEKLRSEFNNQISQLKTELEEVKNKPSTIKNIKHINNGIVNINKGPVYNYITKPGDENINILTEKEIEYIMDQEMNCIIGLVEMLNFNEKYPENHSFCTTALNDKYISAINTETLMIEKFRKTDFYDKILNNGLSNMKLLYNKLGSKRTVKAKRYKETIDKLTEFLVVNNKGKKTYVELINSLTFNKRHIAQSTWFQLQQGIIPPHKSDSDLTTKINDKPDKKPPTKQSLISCPSSDSEDFNDSDTETTTSDDLPEIKIQGVTYYLDENKLYQINNGHKGEYVGELINGKIKKQKSFDI